MIRIRFGKRKRLTNKTAQPLPQCVIPSLNMRCFTCFFTNRVMFLAQQAKNLLISFPEVTEGGTMSISDWYPRPQTPTAFFAAVTNEIGNHLACPTTQGYPNPSFVFFDSTNDHNSSNSSTSSDCAASTEVISGNDSAFSFSHLATVWRATPNVRVTPRKLARS